MAQTQVILLEKIGKLGGMGDVVTVKPGYARNYLLPQKKALRASKENIAYFTAQRKHLEAENDKTRKEAEKLSAKIKDMKVSIIRQASEGGQLYGSVTSRDIADQINANSDVKVERSMISLNDNFKMIGLFDIDVALHPEVLVNVTVNIARSDEEAKTQADTGRALVAGANDVVVEETISGDEQLEEVLEDSALETQKEKKAKAAEKDAEDEVKAVKSAEKSAAKAAKKAAKAPEEEEEVVTEMGASDDE